MSKKQMPPVLRTLTEELKFAYVGPERVGPFDVFYVNLSGWNLSLTDRNPCVWVKSADLERFTIPDLGVAIRDVVRIKRWQNMTVMLFIDGDAGELRFNLPEALPSFLILDAAQQQRVAASSAPSVEMLDILLQQMSRSQLAPYETNKPVVAGRFFGRQSEINRVLQHPNTNFMFVGIRRVGKTSLLKELQRKMDELDPPHDGQIRRLYVDCTVISSADEFLRELVYELDKPQLKLLMGRAHESKRYKRLMFDRFAELHGEPVTFLVDELDRLLARVPPDHELFDVLRAASNAGKARFIFAGFRKAMIAMTDMRTPLFNMVREVRLGKLKRGDVKRMVLSMERLRITIQNRDGIVNRIFRETAGLPNYVQFYCKTLLEQLDDDARDAITEQDLVSVYKNRAFRDFVLDTFMANTEPLERALVYAMIAEDPGDGGKRRTYAQRTIDGILKKRKLNIRLEDLERSCRNLEIAGVFEEVGKNYRFAVPLLQQILPQTRDVDFLFDKTREEILAETLYR